MVTVLSWTRVVGTSRARHALGATLGPRTAYFPLSPAVLVEGSLLGKVSLVQGAVRFALRYVDAVTTDGAAYLWCSSALYLLYRARLCVRAYVRTGTN